MNNEFGSWSLSKSSLGYTKGAKVYWGREMMEIEENVPITKARWGKYSSITHKMKVGDSVLCKNSKEVSGIRVAIYQCEGYKPLGRKQEDGTYRIWKVKK